MLDYIAKPFGLLLLWLYNIVNNYGVAIFLFALVVKLIMLPFQFKSQKGMMRMQMLSPQIQELQKRHEGNQQKLQQEISKLYKDEKVNPMSGCLWMMIPYPILLALYRAVRFPLTTMMGVNADLINPGGAIYNRLVELGFDMSGNNVYIQLRESRFITEHFADFAGLSDKLVAINYDFLGLNLADTPSLRFWLTESWQSGKYWAAIGLFLIPVLSALLSWLQMKLSQATSPGTAAQQAQQQQSMKTMNLMMPLFSLWICFSMPGVMGMYWVYQSILAIIQSLIFNRYFARVLAEETAAREARNREREAELERKREETERLRAEGALKENANVSRKKQQARQKAELDELRAAAIREERAAKRARRGIADPEREAIPASQVGDRRYARGRAYVPDRFTNPDGAEAATAAALAESEGRADAGESDIPETAGDITAAAAAFGLGESSVVSESAGEEDDAGDNEEDYDDEDDDDDDDAPPSDDEEEYEDEDK
ncbi:MAG: membrane protein insertase YidC [Oscillospiraceae bacterium]|nr:membrane protein insertase YidC [Oscillospiraceae bacterium]